MNSPSAPEGDQNIWLEAINRAENHSTLVAEEPLPEDFALVAAGDSYSCELKGHMTRSDREKQLQAMNHSPMGFAELHRIWTLIRDRAKSNEPRSGVTGAAMVVEILNNEFPAE